jgi:hypothetical protein
MSIRTKCGKEILPYLKEHIPFYVSRLNVGQFHYTVRLTLAYRALSLTIKYHKHLDQWGVYCGKYSSLHPCVEDLPALVKTLNLLGVFREEEKT